MDAILELESSFTQLLKTKDLETDAHSCRVAALTEEWIQFMKSRQEWLDLDEQDLVLAARLHDIGKVGVLDRVLQKAGPLTPAEREHLNLHSEIGYELVREIRAAEQLALAVRHHHERWDGGGYPLGLKEDEIPFFAQVISVVDTFDAITSDRPYQKARSRTEALVEIQKNASRQFAPALVDAFVKFLHARHT